jgi:hypothetical protein
MERQQSIVIRGGHSTVNVVSHRIVEEVDSLFVLDAKLDAGDWSAVSADEPDLVFDISESARPVHDGHAYEQQGHESTNSDDGEDEWLMGPAVSPNRHRYAIGKSG